MQTIKNILKKTKQRLRMMQFRIKMKRQLKKRCYILVDTPTHGNLGDHAIALAEQQFLTDNCGIKAYIEITAGDYDVNREWLAKYTSKDVIILIHGGGFMGELWLPEEFRLRSILQNFSDNRIIVFPQTLTFSTQTQAGTKLFEESAKVYCAHKKLTLFVREKKSENFVQEYLPNLDCRLSPDIVTNYRITNKSKKNRKGVLLCLRADLEKSLSNENVQAIKKQIESFCHEEITFTDTVIRSNISPRRRKRQVDKKLREFSQSKLVVTDRLHGMLFAAITGTPCIALSNSNGKVRAVYEWIEKLSYVQFVDNLEAFGETLNNLDLSQEYTYDYSLINDTFKELERTIKECL